MVRINKYSGVKSATFPSKNVVEGLANASKVLLPHKCTVL